MVYSISETDMEVREALKHIPHSPGVYIYRNSEHQVIYVGKGVDLSRRVHQYFTRDNAALTNAVGEKTKLLVSQIADIETISTLNEFDALLLEAKLIRQYLPKFNVIARDDKSPVYILITKEEMPRIEFVRRQVLQGVALKKPSHQSIFGPFQSAWVARDLMRSLRRIVPYCVQTKRNGRPCFYTHIGLCNPCPSALVSMTDEEEKKKLIQIYKKHISWIREILAGKSNRVLKTLEKDMKSASQSKNYEHASVLRDQLQGLSGMLQKHYEPKLYLERGVGDIFGTESGELIAALKPVYPTLTKVDRIECMDISNLGGKQATGSMVVLTKGQPDKSQYRKFKIRMKQVPNDVAMIAEILGRRLNHPEWPYPDLLVIDGGKGQVGSAVNVLTSRTIDIPVIGLAKRREEIIAPLRHPELVSGSHIDEGIPKQLRDDNPFITIRLPLTSPGIHLLERVRDEAHRFAITYHRLLRGKQSLI